MKRATLVGCVVLVLLTSSLLAVPERAKDAVDLAGGSRRQADRQPRPAAGFAVSSDLVVTALSSVDGAKRLVVTVEGMPLEATLVKSDAKLGLALLKVSGQTLNGAPIAKNATPGEVECACFPTDDLFNPSAVKVGGTLSGKSGAWVASLSRHPRLAGSPIARGGQIIGVVMGAEGTDAASLPVIGADVLRAFTGEVQGNGDVASAMVQVVGS